jgi:beta-glucanase (GH16 family)
MAAHSKHKVVAGIIVCCTSLLYCSSTRSAPSNGSDIPSDYKLVWSDEFNTAGLPDSRSWDFQTFANNVLWWHNERQYYTNKRKENADVADGVLRITARKEVMTGAPGWVGQEYTSAKLTTLGHHAWTYGFFDIRAKLACGRGAWPAIWLMSTTDKWPNGGEIDILESVGFEQPPIAHATIHDGMEGKEPLVTGRTPVPDACSTFHNYQLDWRADGMTFLVDGHPILHRDKAGLDYAHWPFDHPFYLILNLTVGGAWGAQRGIDAGAFPQTMEIDYVRVYQRP